MILTENAWSNQPCYIVGGGPSLRSFNWSWLKGKPRVICVNRSFIDVPTADMWFSEDARVIGLWGEKLRAFQGLKVLHCLNEGELAEVQHIDPNIQIIRTKRKDKFWSHSFEQGLSYSSNSVVGAMNIATILDADPIYLLGVDCRADGPMLSNYHSDYKFDPMWEVGSNAADNFRSDFEGWVKPHVKDRQVINLINRNYESALECWPKVPWEHVLGPRPICICGFEAPSLEYLIQHRVTCAAAH